MNNDFIKMARYAIKAPSGHNTQPWKFKIEEDTVTIIPDFKVALPVVDGDNRELYISLGCAAENLCIAANHFGYKAHLTMQNSEGITIQLSKSYNVIENRLFFQIEKRQTNRSIYKGIKIPDETLNQLQSIHIENNIQFYWTEIGTPLADTITENILEGNKIQMTDTAFKNELLSWMRFNRQQVEATQDGLSYKVFGNPPLPAKLAKPIVSLFLKANTQNQSDKKGIESSSHFLVSTTRHYTIKEWIDLGRTLQRFLLKANEVGVTCAFLNQPCEIPVLASILQKELPNKEEYPTIILRIGYAKPLPYSPRKKIETLCI